MVILQQTAPAVNLAISSKRALIRRYHPLNAPTITACCTYADSDGGLVAVSIRNTPAMSVASTLNWDCGIIDQLAADGISRLEIHTGGTIYSTTIDDLKRLGQVQTRWAGSRQWALSLRYYWINGQPPAPASTQPQPQAPAAVQPALFDLSAHQPRRKGGY